MAYDSTEDTCKHIERVQDLIDVMVINLFHRANKHDRSKLLPPEKPIFDEYTPKLKDSTYGSDEYKSYLASMQEALQHHYACNSHHPEHHVGGIAGMSLLDLIEMLADWKAATERHANGDIRKSIDINTGRFRIDPQLAVILHNTVRELGW